MMNLKRPGFYFIATLLLCASALAGCGGTQTPLNPAADQAARISREWWIFLVVLGGVWGLVMAALLAASFRRPLDTANEPAIPLPVPLRSGREFWITVGVSGAVTMTVIILLVLLFGDFMVNREASSPAPADAMTIQLVGHQWWWEARYENDDPSKIVTAANELHIPTGRAVKFELSSVDVIHSFWVPNLSGKKDLIPGHPTSTWFIATKPGTYRGLCAEFCGAQHAHMRLTITAEPPEKFDAWIAAQRQPPPEPQNDAQKRGQQVFLGSTCVMCHTIRGTPARATVGPDLTHLASREWLAAGTVPNARGWLGGWILDPQTLKPGARMPQHHFNGEELTALLDYLETLK